MIINYVNCFSFLFQRQSRVKEKTQLPLEGTLAKGELPKCASPEKESTALRHRAGLVDDGAGALLAPPASIDEPAPKIEVMPVPRQSTSRPSGKRRVVADPAEYLKYALLNARDIRLGLKAVSDADSESESEPIDDDGEVMDIFDTTNWLDREALIESLDELKEFALDDTCVDSARDFAIAFFLEITDYVASGRGHIYRFDKNKSEDRGVIQLFSDHLVALEPLADAFDGPPKLDKLRRVRSGLAEMLA
jgi:hypothetical protein